MRRIVAVLVAVLLLAGATAGVGSAGDGSILVYPSEEQHTAAPGEEVEIHVVVSHHGTAYGDGLETVSVVGEYDDSVLELTDAEPGSWFETEDHDGDIATETTTEDGLVNVTQHREPANGGVIGTERFVTLTFEVDSEAAAENTTVDLGGSNVVIAGGFPSPIFETNPQITVESIAENPGDDEPADDDGAPPIPLAAVGGLIAALVLRWQRTRKNN